MKKKKNIFLKSANLLFFFIKKIICFFKKIKLILFNKKKNVRNSTTNKIKCDGYTKLYEGSLRLVRLNAFKTIATLQCHKACSTIKKGALNQKRRIEKSNLSPR